MIICGDRAGQVRLTYRIVGLNTSILDIEAILWQTWSDLVEISAARHARQGAVRKVCRRAVSFTSRAEVAYNDDGSVTVDVRRVLGDRLRAKMRAEVAASGRFNH